ncbi:MAG: dUTP diphosphatase [Peptostreptococcaceae bacterium]|jgi:dUTP diphosphatase|nr:dUTP diphosphatase [Peptostreptococcaceae bacterium]
MIEVKVKKLSPNAVVPKYAHATDTGFDLYTSEDILLDPHSTGIAKTGLAFELPAGWGIMLRNRSGITVKGCPVVLPFDNLDIKIPVTVFIGTLDEDYRGEVGIMVRNESKYTIIIPKGTKLAQGVLEKIHQATFTVVEELSETTRGEGGFGSTGV